MKKLLFILMFVASFVMSPFAFAEESLGEFAAPGGVKWGWTKAEFQAVGVDVNGCTVGRSGHFSICNATILPKNISFAKKYVLLFDNKSDRLVKVVIIGKDITEDYFGVQGKEIYQKVKEAISKKYPNNESNSYERTGGVRLFDGSDEFYECLRLGSKCGTHATFFNPKEENGGGIVIELKGKGPGKGHISVHYESGLFSSLKDQYAKQDDEADEEAL